MATLIKPLYFYIVSKIDLFLELSRWSTTVTVHVAMINSFIFLLFFLLWESFKREVYIFLLRFNFNTQNPLKLKNNIRVGSEQ